MEIAEHVTTLRRRWVSILLVALITTAAALVLTLFQTRQYSSNARVFVSAYDLDTSNAYAGGQLAQSRVASYAELVDSRPLAEEVIERTEVDVTAAELSDSVSATIKTGTVNLDIKVTLTDPAIATLIAQNYAEAMVDLVKEIETPEGRTVAYIQAKVIDEASYSGIPSWPLPIRNLAFGLILGAVLGVGLAALRESLDARVTSTDDLASATQKPVLGATTFDSTIDVHPVISDSSRHSRRAEEFRVLRTNLQFVDAGNQSKILVFAAAVPGEGRSSTSVNIAVSFARAGVRTLLVEGDLRRPQASGRLHLNGSIGVTNVLIGATTFDDAVQVDPNSGLHFLAAGPVPPNPADLIRSQAMQQLMRYLRDSYDVVIVDAPPLLPFTDGALLAAHADGAILVVRHGRVTHEQLRLSIKRLEQVGSRLLGSVANMVPVADSSSGFGYTYGYESADVSDTGAQDAGIRPAVDAARTVG